MILCLKLFIYGTILLICSGFSAPSFLYAQQEALDSSSIKAASQLQSFYSSISSLSFTFVQSTTGQMIGREKTGKGHGLFARTENGAKMRWDYNDPERQVLISDGETISMYFETLNQMIVSPVDQSQADILFAIFGGQGALEDSFTILDTEVSEPESTTEAADQLQAVHLIPKSPDSQMATISLYYTADKLIRRVELVDHFETRTIITINDIKLNPLSSEQLETASALFAFTPPEGTEIITQ